MTDRKNQEIEKKLRDRLQIGIDQIERGECTEIKDREALKKFFEDIRNKSKYRRK